MGPAGLASVYLVWDGSRCIRPDLQRGLFYPRFLGRLENLRFQREGYAADH